MTFTFQNYLDDECTFAQYKASLSDLVKLELGKTYVQAKGTWHEMHYKIIFSDEKVSMGICVKNAISQKYTGDYCLFNTQDGFKYQDIRPTYRLKELT